jgi:hypothetical protein
MLETIREMEHELDRLKLFNDPMSRATLEVSLQRWIKALQDYEPDPADCDNCIDYRDQLDETYGALADAEERIRKAKEIL